MKFLRHVSPSSAATDLADAWRENPYRWRVLAISAALTGGMLYAFLPADQRAALPLPQITWITTLDDTRTQAEIIASNEANQKRQDELDAADAERAEFRKQLYRDLGRATGLDVDEMEAQIKRDEAAEAARKAAALAPVKIAPAQQDTGGQ